MRGKVDISIVIPVRDEGGSIKILVEQIQKAIKGVTNSFEIIFVDDGSIDESYKIIKEIQSKNRHIKCVKHRRNFGKSQALTSGFSLAKGKYVITMDGDLQDDPKEISKFIKELKKGADMVSGWKVKRLDSIIYTIPSKVGNWVISFLTGLKIHDLNCGFKAYKREVIKNIRIYGELYRFIPILANQQGYKVVEIKVHHRKRRFGKSKYNFLKIIHIILDLITVLFLTGYSTHPGHFFGTIGIICLIPGFLIGGYITYLRFTTGGIDYRYPLLFLGVLFILVGIQFISTGLLAETFIYTSSKKNERS